ncbi:hypothetical protein GGF31_001470 [Allomyces arbusculus]|nr:hypothetical protein GGF31_001470 [Allomyces arbusculus]
MLPDRKRDRLTHDDDCTAVAVTIHSGPHSPGPTRGQRPDTTVDPVEPVCGDLPSGHDGCGRVIAPAQVAAGTARTRGASRESVEKDGMSPPKAPAAAVGAMLVAAVHGARGSLMALPSSSPAALADGEARVAAGLGM